MKFNLIAPIVATLTTAVATLSMNLPAHARPAQYNCGVINGIPTTVARTPKGTVAVITWKSNHFSNSGFSPLKRCQAVSARFQKHSNQGSLRFITIGTMNNQKVMCVAQKIKGACRSDGLLLTLEPQDNPQQVIRDLFNVSRGASSGPTGRDAPAVYINVDNYLQSVPQVAPNSIENETTAPVETQSQENQGSPAAVNTQSGARPVW